MSPARVILATIVGAILMFLWNFVAHTMLPLGDAGIREMPNESAIVDPMKANLGDVKGLFIFPGSGLGPEATREQRHKAMEQGMGKMAENPSGLLMYHPKRAFNFPMTLGVEFATEFAQALLAVFLLAQTRIARPLSRLGFVTVAGVLAAITTNISYWNWYGFPKRYIASYMLIETVGFILVGIACALVLKRNDT
jgi:hypothetical protein